MNKLKIFLEFVELRTKVASVFPMSLGFLWTYYQYGTINVKNALVFALAVLTFDMCTTAINNAVDYHKAVDLDYKVNENIIGVHQLDFRKMLHIIFGLLGISIIASLLLVVWTDPLLLLLGAICFAIGIGYTYGPMPLSRLPLGEIFSGVTMGFGIFFLAIYMTSYEQLFSSAWSLGGVIIVWNWLETLRIFAWSLPLVFLIAGIMLANNTCDLETDIANGRYTLVYYIGKQQAVRLYTALQIGAWVVWLIILLWSGNLWQPLIAGMCILPLHVRSIQRFRAKQIKRETFVESVKSFVMFSSMYVLVLVLITIF